MKKLSGFQSKLAFSHQTHCILADVLVKQVTVHFFLVLIELMGKNYTKFKKENFGKLYSNKPNVFEFFETVVAYFLVFFLKTVENCIKFEC